MLHRTLTRMCRLHSLRLITHSRLPTVSHSRIRILSSTVSQIKTYYQQPQPNKTSYGQQFTNSPNNDYGANQSKYGNQYQSYNNGYNQQYNTQYQQTYNSQPVPPVAPPYGTPDTQPVSIGGWIGVMLLTCLPLVNLIMLFVLGIQLINKEVTKKLRKSRSYPDSYRSCACGSCFNYTCSLRYQYLQRIFQFRILLSLSIFRS